MAVGSWRLEGAGTRRAVGSSRPDVWCYTWDAEDRLTTCTTPDGTTWTYRYDPLGRRTAKQRASTTTSWGVRPWMRR
nr:hypothetical protein [Streptomyces himalayensis]